MPLIGLFGALSIVTVATLWAGVKLTVYVLRADDSEECYQFVRATMDLVKPFWVSIVALGVLIELWPGLASWSTAAFEVLLQIW